MDNQSCDRAVLKKFGMTMGLAFLVIAGIIFIRHRNSPSLLLIISGIFFVFALAAPVFLRPVYIFWMRLAVFLGWINTRIILLVIFYLVFTPISLAQKMFGKDLLDRRIDKASSSYWHKKEQGQFSPMDCQRQF